MSKYILALVVFLCPVAVLAQNITLINNEAKAFTQPVLNALKAQNVDFNQYREIRIKAVHGAASVYLLSKKYHRFDKMVFDINGAKPRQVHAFEVEEAVKPRCPDESVEFIAFAPNNDEYELQITEGVAQAAEAHGLKVARLYKTVATAHAYLDYMSCSKLRGNFYDGDANPTEIVTADGSLSSKAMSRSLAKAFHQSVVNIWLACEAFNNPIRNVMLSTLQSQKYAAGYNDLEIGPSDETAACAMKAALNGEPMTQAFNNCRKLHDTKEDQWGFMGSGSEYFGR